MKIGYIVKRYPRYSETFIVNEILAHERAGLEIEIFSLYAPVDTHFQDLLALVRAPVTYVLGSGMSASDLWSSMVAAAEVIPDIWSSLAAGEHARGSEMFQAAQIARIVHEHGIDHLHAHFATVATTVARIASRLAGITYSFTAHAKDIYHQSVDPADLERKLSDAAAVVTVSDFNVSYLRGQFATTAAHVRRIYNGLDLERFTFRDDAAARSPEVISVGRLVEKKGFDVLLDACALLRDRGVRFHCTIVGTGELELALRRRADELSLRDIVELAGALPQAQVVERLRRGALFAGAYVVGEDGNRDGLPTVLVESMALGVPCVASDVTGVAEVVRDGRTGLLVGQRDAPGLSQAIERVLSDSALRTRLAREARRLIESEFDARKNTAEMRTMFIDAVKKPDRLEVAL